MRAPERLLGVTHHEVSRTDRPAPHRRGARRGTFQRSNSSAGSSPPLLTTFLQEPRSEPSGPSSGGAISEPSSELASTKWTGLEPTASTVTKQRYNQLNYHPKFSPTVFCRTRGRPETGWPNAVEDLLSRLLGVNRRKVGSMGFGGIRGIASGAVAVGAGPAGGFRPTVAA